MQVTLKVYEITAWKLCPIADHIEDLFIHVLDGAERLLFIHNAKKGDSYDMIKDMMISEYSSDARRVQVERNLQMILLRNVMSAESITDVQKGLTAQVKIQEMAPQCHQEFQTDRHK